MGADSEGSVRRKRRGVGLAVLVTLMAMVPVAATAQGDEPDPRVGLSAGLWDAGEAISGLDHQAWFQKRDGALQGLNTDLAFTGNHLYMGNYSGFQIFDISDPGNPVLKTEVQCPGNQNDVSVYGDLLFQSVEQTNAKVDCTTTPPANAQTRFRGIRIYDISNREVPVLVGGVQLCRGSHTHSVVEDLDDPDHVYIYNSGAAGQRPAAEAVHTPNGLVTGRCGGALSSTVPVFDNRPTFMTEVVKVPLADPAAAHVVNEARLFVNPETGQINSLQNSPQTPLHPSGEPWIPVPDTNTCHDITAFPDLGLLAGACQGNGILVDIADPANPVRLDAVADPIFTYWHSATFNNDGTSVLFTDEWFGGGGIRCRSIDDLTWGADGIYDIVDTPDGPRMEFRSYYKMPAHQANNENCVAHNASLIPIPGRDILVQAWYQGGVSIIDWTDSANPTEIAFFDRGPIDPTSNSFGGFWSAYWYNGNVYGSEIARGLDVFDLIPTEHLSATEIAAAKEIRFAEVNIQGQRQFRWGPSANVVGAYRDQHIRNGTIGAAEVLRVNAFLTQAGQATTRRAKQNAAGAGHRIAARLDAGTQGDLRDAVLLLADYLQAQARPS